MAPHSTPIVAATTAALGAGLLLNSAFVAPKGAEAPTVRQNLRAGGLSSSTTATDASLSRAAQIGSLAFGGCAIALLSRGQPKRQSKDRVCVKAFESELGAQAPFGFWDPLGLTKDGDVAAFKRRRETELKHGRVAMIAAMGYITPEYTKFPGFCSPSENLKFEDIPNGLAALSKVPGVGWMQIFLFIGFVEKAWFVHDPSRAPGDYAKAGVLGVPNGSTMMDGEDRKRKLNSELANGRLAMMAITGMFFQDGLTGCAWGDWAMYEASPLRAFESELGVQAPVGFWDPAGFTQDGDVDAFKRRREVELKHGRVSMFATIGFIVPEYFRWPGDCSPSEGVRFDEIPNGLGALSRVPFLGWCQIIVFCGLIDFGLYRSDPDRAPGDYANAGILGVPNASGPMADTEGRKRKLNAELANGRLAMVAVMGMMFQNGTVGSAGPEMWGF